MATKKKARSTIPVSLEKDTGIELLIKEKQPVVHTTFRFSREAHEAISGLAVFLGVKNAELFERLLIFYGKSSVSLAETKEGVKSVRKTYVVKKETLAKLGEIAKDRNTTRDLLIERTALAFMNILDKSLSEKKEGYSDVLEKMIRPFCGQAGDLDNELSRRLGYDDPIVRRFSFVSILAEGLATSIENYLNQGIPIDPEDFSQD